MLKESLDSTKAGVEPVGSKTGELSEADLDSVAGGLIGIASRKTPVPEDGRSITGAPIPTDGRSIAGLPVPEDGKS